MSVAVYVNMENSDSYLMCFEDTWSLSEVLSDIEDTIMDNGPICDYRVEGSDSTDEDRVSDIYDIIEELHSLSWK